MWEQYLKADYRNRNSQNKIQMYFCGFHWKQLGALLNLATWLTFLVIDLVLYLCVLSLSTMVPVFGIFPTTGISWTCATDVFSLIVPISFSTFSLFPGATAEILLRPVFFGGPPIGVSLVMNYWLVLKVLHGWLDALLGKIFIFGILLGSYFGVSLVMFPWLAPSEVLFGRVILQISLIGISMFPCVNLLVGRVGWQFLDFWMHELNLVQNEW